MTPYAFAVHLLLKLLKITVSDLPHCYFVTHKIKSVAPIISKSVVMLPIGREVSYDAAE